MKASIFVVLSLLAGAIALIPPHYEMKDAPKLFEKFIHDYHRHYSSTTELLTRYEYFKNFLAEIIRKNAIPGAVFDIDDMADLSYEEFLQRTGFLPIPSQLPSHIRSNDFKPY